MSRIGKKIITIPEKVDIKIEGNAVIVTGPLGTLSSAIHPAVTVEKKEEGLSLSISNKNKTNSALWGTVAAHIVNNITGVTKGFTKKLIIEGIGYKMDVKGNEIVMALGFSHPVHLAIPAGLKVTAEKGVTTITGINKDLVGQFAAIIRDHKKPEPYKGKGIRYEGEYIRRKQGKKSV